MISIKKYIPLLCLFYGLVAVSSSNAMEKKYKASEIKQSSLTPEWLLTILRSEVPQDERIRMLLILEACVKGDALPDEKVMNKAKRRLEHFEQLLQVTQHNSDADPRREERPVIDALHGHMQDGQFLHVMVASFQAITDILDASEREILTRIEQESKVMAHQS